jgi:hypothetical protein
MLRKNKRRVGIAAELKGSNPEKQEVEVALWDFRNRGSRRTRS